MAGGRHEVESARAVTGWGNEHPPLGRCTTNASHKENYGGEGEGAADFTALRTRPCSLLPRCPQAAAYSTCPGLKNTHLDHTLGTEARVAKLVAAATLAEQINQLTNKAPAIERLGIPAHVTTPVSIKSRFEPIKIALAGAACERQEIDHYFVLKPA